MRAQSMLRTTHIAPGMRSSKRALAFTRSIKMKATISSLLIMEQTKSITLKKAFSSMFSPRQIRKPRILVATPHSSPTLSIWSTVSKIKQSSFTPREARQLNVVPPPFCIIKWTKLAKLNVCIIANSHYMIDLPSVQMDLKYGTLVSMQTGMMLKIIVI